MIIEIGHLSLRLPRGFESRANTIAHRISKGLGQQNWHRDIHMDHLRLPPLSISPHEGDNAIAQKVVAAILEGIERRQN